MEEIKTYTFFTNETAPHYGTVSYEIPVAIKSFHLWAITSAGTGSISADVEGSNDGVNWFWVANHSIGTVTTSGTGVQATVTNAFKYHRINMYGITGTDCTAHSTVCFID